jgi:lipoprotein-anchoring transpeptidase ErfK/SrfK
VRRGGVLAMLLIAGGLALTGLAACGNDEGATGQARAQPGGPAPALASRGDTAPQPAPAAVPGEGSVTAWVQKRTVLRSAPVGGRRVARVRPKTEFGTARVMPVIERRGRWLGVHAEEAGNNVVAWLPLASASLYRVPWRIDVDLSDRRLVAHRGEQEQMSVAVAIGTAQTPTPTGSFYVTDRLRDGRPGSPYGCCILALSAHQPHLREGWGGGDRIAIHSTPNQASIGRAASNGCLRVRTDDMRVLLRRIPIGTRVQIKD